MLLVRERRDAREHFASVPFINGGFWWTWPSGVPVESGPWVPRQAPHDWCRLASRSGPGIFTAPDLGSTWGTRRAKSEPCRPPLSGGVES